MSIIAEIILPVDQHEAVPEPHQVGEKVACHSAQSRIDNHPHSRRHGGRLRPWRGFVRFHVGGMAISGQIPRASSLLCQLLDSFVADPSAAVPRHLPARQLQRADKPVHRPWWNS